MFNKSKSTKIKALGGRSRIVGSTLIEMAMVLMLIGILLGVAMVGKRYFQKEKANEEAATLQRVIANLQSKYRRQPNTDAVTTASAAQGNVFDKDMVNTATWTVMNRYQGNVTIVPAKINSATVNDGFLMTSAGIDDIGCERIPVAMDALLAKVVVTNLIGTVTTVKATSASSISPAALDTACDGDINNLALYFTQNG